MNHHTVKKINKVILCSNMSGYFPQVIDVLEKAKVKIAKIFLMKEDYYLNNKTFFDRMLSAGLACDLRAYLKSEAYDVSLIDNISDSSIMKQIESIEPDLIINNGMMFVYPKGLVTKYSVINTHSGALPFYRGRCGGSWAIYNGDSKYSITCHFMDEGLDTGPIILQKEIEIKKTDYVYDILLKEKEYYPILIAKSIDKLMKGTFQPKRQSKFEGSYFPVLRSSVDGIINWQLETTERIYNKVRAFSYPYDGAFTIANETKYVISRAGLPEKNEFVCSEPGLVFRECSDGSMNVSTIDGYIIVKRIITEQGEFAPSAHWKVGQYIYTNLLKQHVCNWQQNATIGSEVRL